MITPFSAEDRNDQNLDDANFYISQVRIIVEQTFGIFMGLFPRFRTSCQMELGTVSRLVQVAGRLQNFIMTERLPGPVSTIDAY